MEILRDAAQAVQRNLSALFQYLAFIAGYSLMMSALRVYVLSRFGPEDASMLKNISVLAVLLAGTAWIAAAQALVFTRMGREIDKPLWKVRDAAEGFRRFYMLWFEFNLIVHTLNWVLIVNVDSPAFQVFKLVALLAFLSAAIVLVPFGACIMFHGRFSWETLGESLAPLAKQFPRALPIFLVTFIQIYLGFYIGVRLEPDTAEPTLLDLTTAIQLATDVALGYLDCLAFAATWLVCVVDRESPDEIDLDF